MVFRLFTPITQSPQNNNTLEYKHHGTGVPPRIHLASRAPCAAANPIIGFEIVLRFNLVMPSMTNFESEASRLLRLEEHSEHP